MKAPSVTMPMALLRRLSVCSRDRQSNVCVVMVVRRLWARSMDSSCWQNSHALVAMVAIELLASEMVVSVDRLKKPLLLISVS